MRDSKQFSGFLDYILFSNLLIYITFLMSFHFSRINCVKIVVYNKVQELAK